VTASPVKKKIVYVIGHRTPDTDSVCSAIGYAHFKNITDKGFIFMPARAGQLNEETRFVLERFNMPAPDEIESLAPTVSDLELSRPISVHERDSVHSLALLMREKGVRTAPVVNDAGRVAGIVGLRDIAHFYVGSAGLTDLTNAPISLDIFLRTMDGRVLSNARRVTELKGRVLIGSFQRGTLLNTIHEGDIVVLGDQQDVQLELIKAGCGTLIITDGLPVGSETLKRAEQSGTLVISSPHPAFATVQFLLMSEPVSSIMSRSPVNVGLYTPISELRKRIIHSDYRSAIVADSEDRLIGFITRTDLLEPVRKRAILVDHNEVSHAVDNVDEAEILEIIDHHRVGDISTAAPIYVYNDPVGSTCTVVAGMMFLYQVDIPVEVAGVLLSGILSDTLLLSLSTTTDRDRQVAERLAEVAGLSLRDYGKELLHASIHIGNKSAAELIAADFREVRIYGKKLGISQMMVLDCEEIDLREGELLDELERLRQSEGYDMTAMLVTNPLHASHERVLLKGDTWIVEKAFNVEVRESTCRLPGVLSRKKDFIPAVGRVLSTA